MATAGIVNCSPYGMACTECDELVIAPELSEYLGSREVRHFWSCENCGHKLEMMVDLRISATSKPIKQVGVGPIAEVWPNSW
jgi:hypothetical protein